MVTPETAREILEPRDATPLPLELRAVRHGYTLADRDLSVLDEISLRVKPREFVVLLGPSGCGKSTLLRLAAGLELPRFGTVLAAGDPVRGPGPDRVVMFQDPTLFPWRSVRRNVSLGHDIRGRPIAHAVDAMLDLVGLTPFAKAWPHQLSGGMAQRAALARALVNEPSLLILDEPFGKLDSLTRMTMQNELLQLWQRRQFTALMITHDVEEAVLLGTRIVVLSDAPARIRSDIAVELPYPRHRDDTRLIALRRDILSELGHREDW